MTMTHRMRGWPGPTPDEIERGVPYCFDISMPLDSLVSIYADPGTHEARWHCRPEPRRSAWSPLNLWKKPAFVVVDNVDCEQLRIARRRRFPPRFDIIQNGEVVGSIELRSLLRNRYTLVLKSGPIWTVRMPLFSLHFHAYSDANSRVWIFVGPSKAQWNLLAEAEADLRLLAGLAFIHREWWCYS